MHKGEASTNDSSDQSDEHGGAGSPGSASGSDIQDEEEADAPPPRSFLKPPPAPSASDSGKPPTHNRAFGHQNLANALPLSGFAHARQDTASLATPTGPAQHRTSPDSELAGEKSNTQHLDLRPPLQRRPTTDESSLLPGDEKAHSVARNPAEENGSVRTSTRNRPSQRDTAAKQDKGWSAEMEVEAGSEIEAEVEAEADAACGKITTNLQSFLQEALAGVKPITATITLTEVDESDGESDDEVDPDEMDILSMILGRIGVLAV